MNGGVGENGDDSQTEERSKRRTNGEDTSGLAPRVARRRGCVRTADASTPSAPRVFASAVLPHPHGADLRSAPEPQPFLFVSCLLRFAFVDSVAPFVNLRSLRSLRRKYTIPLEGRMRRIGWVSCATLALAGVLAAAQDGDWSAYGRDPGGERFSPLDRIRRENVGSLQVAWTFRTGDAYEPKAGRGDRVRSNAALRRRHALSEHARSDASSRSIRLPASNAGLSTRSRRATWDTAISPAAASRRGSGAANVASSSRRSTRGSSLSTPARASRSPALAIEASSICVRDCGSRRSDSPTTRSPLRPRLSATRSSSDLASRTAHRSRIRAAKCAASMP